MKAHAYDRSRRSGLFAVRVGLNWGRQKDFDQRLWKVAVFGWGGRLGTYKAISSTRPGDLERLNAAHSTWKW
jgi:hypothetical protein